MEERPRFIGRLLDGENMAAACREFGISRKTGHKIFNRCKDCGLEGLHDRSRRPIRQANRLPFQVERTILQIKREKPSRGAPKIRERLIRQYLSIQTPAKSTVHAVLERNGMVEARRKRRYNAPDAQFRKSARKSGSCFLSLCASLRNSAGPLFARCLEVASDVYRPVALRQGTDLGGDGWAAREQVILATTAEGLRARRAMAVRAVRIHVPRHSARDSRR